jgi:hypothetical protein
MSFRRPCTEATVSPGNGDEHWAEDLSRARCQSFATFAKMLGTTVTLCWNADDVIDAYV